ncbi:MAG: glycosyltransferase family 2 protein [Gammaproteobacteria bacterium]
MLPLISICIPVLNEEANILNLYKRLNELSVLMKDKCNFEFLFTDNHSEDNTWELLKNLAAKDPRVRAIRFSKNVGFQRSILANYMHAKGDAVFQIDADLQDPPELFEQFFELWRQGYKVVYGIRRKRTEGFLLNTLRKFGYWFIDKVSEYPIPKGAGDFRLLDKKVVDALKKYNATKPYLRGIIAGMGFNQIGITYDRSARTQGESKFSLRQLISLGITGVFNHSVIPLRLATYAGLFLLILSVFGSLYYVCLKLLKPDLPIGLASIHILVLFGIGFQSLLLGVLGEYLLRIYILMRNEPIALAESTLNFCDTELEI